MDFPWSHGVATFVSTNSTQVVGNLYIGLNGVVHDVVTTDPINGEMHETVFESYFDSSNRCKSAYCEDCRGAASSCWQTVIIALIVSIPTLMSDYTRSHSNEDTNFEKSLGFIGGIAGGCLDLYGLFSYADLCVDELPLHSTRDGITKTMHWEEGIGLKCLIASTFLLILDGLLHLIVPSPKSRQVALEEDETLLAETKYLLSDTQKRLQKTGSELQKTLSDTGNELQKTLSSVTGGVIAPPDEQADAASKEAAAGAMDPEAAVGHTSAAAKAEAEAEASSA